MNLNEASIGSPSFLGGPVCTERATRAAAHIEFPIRHAEGVAREHAACGQITHCMVMHGVARRVQKLEFTSC